MSPAALALVLVTLSACGAASPPSSAPESTMAAQKGSPEDVARQAAAAAFGADPDLVKVRHLELPGVEAVWPFQASTPGREGQFVGGVVVGGQALLEPQSALDALAAAAPAGELPLDRWVRVLAALGRRHSRPSPVRSERDHERLKDTLKAQVTPPELLEGDGGERGIRFWNLVGTDPGVWEHTTVWLGGGGARREVERVEIGG